MFRGVGLLSNHPVYDALSVRSRSENAYQEPSVGASGCELCRDARRQPLYRAHIAMSVLFWTVVSVSIVYNGWTLLTMTVSLPVG